MNIIWVSANRFGYELLKHAVMTIPNQGISSIITLHPDATTRMYDGVPDNDWNTFDLPVHRVKVLNEESALVRSLSPDVLIVCGWRQLLHDDILTIPKKGTIGFHPTLLPFGRGPAPIINSILLGVKRSGVTMFYLSEGLDNGDIIGQEPFDISGTDHAADVYQKVIHSGKRLISTFLPKLVDGTAPRVPQDHTKAVEFSKPALSGNRIDPDKETPEDMYRKIRALSKPYNGAYIEKNGRRVIIWNASLQDI